MARTEAVVLTNMCMVCDGNKILVQDRLDPDWPGITFPGGHVEPCESFVRSAIREVYDHMKPDAVCREVCAGGLARMRDRMGKEFPILREASPAGRGHRNVIYNALPLGMSDRAEELTRAGISRRNFIFSVETPDEVDGVIMAYAEHRPLGCEVRRMLK